MSEPSNIEAQPSTVEAQPSAVIETNKPKTVTELVGEKLASSGPIVRERVVEILIDKEITRRTQQIIQAGTEIDNLEGQLSKLKPDVIILNENNKPAQPPGYTPNRIKEREKLKKRIAGLRSGIDNALQNNNYSLLDKAIKGDYKKNENESESDESTDLAN